MFRDVADIQTADMLKLPVPKVKYENVIVEPSEIQKKMVEELSERAAVSPTFYGWMFSFGGRIEIDAPEEVRAGYAAIARKYGLFHSRKRLRVRKNDH
ncbi:hypothetical protein FACS1894188_07540 [Clostridia bacterium]|nr:hypothetical protein FACS1894188_07540 [Clostridia bacterium]